MRLTPITGKSYSFVKPTTTLLFGKEKNSQKKKPSKQAVSKLLLASSIRQSFLRIDDAIRMCLLQHQRTLSTKCRNRNARRSFYQKNKRKIPSAYVGKKQSNTSAVAIG